MSLRPDARSSRSRSKSPGRGRERSASHSRAPSPSHHAVSSAHGHPGSQQQYDLRQPQIPTSLPNYATPASAMMTGSQQLDSNFTMGGYTDLPPHERPGYVPPQDASAAWNYTANPLGQPPLQQPHRNLSYTGPGMGGYQYAALSDKITYSAKPVVASQSQPAVIHTVNQHHPSTQPPYPQGQSYYPSPPPGVHPSAHPPPNSRGNSQTQLSSPPPGAFPYGNVVEVTPGSMKPPQSPRARPHSLSVGGGRPQDLRAPPSPGLTPRMERLSVSGNRPDVHTMVPGQLPPPSPLLEAYHGTYQSISPMALPMMLPHDDIDDLPPLSPHASSHRRGGSSSHHRQESPASSKRKSKDKERRVKIYDAEQDALDLVEALSHRSPDPGPLIDILTQLSHDQILELRSEYKRHCKVQGRGINIAKHIKMKTTGNFGKICYVTALGRWECEAYWANTWYQSSNARRELLIEALMGRSNSEIYEIKKAFKDKRYNDDLEKCMEKELKADKFRKAVLMALDERRQEEREGWPLEHRNRDVDILYRALKAREGGESAMLEVVVTRSDTHLRDVLKTYERKYQGNFARDALKKSNNLVGEVIAHILNGVINKPARDAMLLHHALMDLIEPSSAPTPSSSSAGLSSKSSKHERQQRVELLVSRLVRLHWDRLHFMRVKDEYLNKYGRDIEEDIEEATKRGDFQEFCLALCDIGK